MKQRGTMMIKNLCPGLMEMGKIKIGNKGQIRKTANGTEWQAPQKLDHFLITTNERGKDNNFLLDEGLHRLFGDTPKSIPIRLIYDDISLNFASRYICYYGKTVFCAGDGEEADRLQPDKKIYAKRACPCERQEPTFAGDIVDGKVKAGQGKCKINGILSVIIDGAQSVGGVWKFRTTSYNSVVGILSSLALIQRITGGRLAGIPINLTVSPKSVNDPISQKQQTIYVVGLQYAGSMDSLRDTGYQIALTEAKHGISMAQIEDQARMLLSHTPAAGLGDDPAEDVIAEFYPEEARPASVISPVLVTPMVEIIDVETGEITEKPAPTLPPAETPEQKQKRIRRTKGQIETDRLANTPPPTENPTDEDDFPDPPATAPMLAEPTPVEAPAVTSEPVPAEEEMGDLF